MSVKSFVITEIDIKGVQKSLDFFCNCSFHKEAITPYIIHNEFGLQDIILKNNYKVISYLFSNLAFLFKICMKQRKRFTGYNTHIHKRNVKY